MQAVIEDGVAVDAHPRHHLHREGRGRDEDARAQRASSSSAGAPTRAPPRRPGSRRSTASARACCALTRSARASTRTSACSTSSRPSASPLDAFDRALESLPGRGRGARAPRAWSRPTRRTACATWCAPPTRDCAAAARAARASRRREPPRAAGERERLEAAVRAALAELAAAGAGKSVADGDRATRALRGRCSSGRRRASSADPDDLEELTIGENANALCTPACDEYRAALGAYAGPLSRRSASTATTRCCASCSSSTATATPRRKRARSGTRLRGPRADRARPARGRRGTARAVRRALRPRARGRVPGHQPAPERAARAARARQPVSGRGRAPVDLRLSQRRRRASSAAIGPRRPRRGARRASRSTSAAAARCSRRSTAALSRPGARTSSRLREARRRPRASAAIDAVRRAAGDRQAQEALGRGARRRRSLRARHARRHLLARAPRRGCWRSGSRSSRRRADGTGATSCCCFAPPRAWASTSGRSRSAASPRTWSAGAATGPSSRWPTCATGCPPSRTRSTSWPCTACSPRRWAGCRSMPWR